MTADPPPVDFFGDDAHTIVIRVAPTTGDRYAVSTNSTNPDARWTARALRLAAEAALIGEDGPAITMSGHLVERSGSSPEATP